MRKVRCIIVEDEKPAQEILKSFIAKTDWLELTGVFDDGVSALDFLNKNDVDLIFLDIQIPSINGMDFLKILRNPPDIIITTAYSEYAIGAFELEVMDYLKKPFSFERFLKAVNRINVQKETPTLLQPAIHSDQDFAFFNVNKTMTKVMFEDILYVESMREYIYLHTSKGKIITKMSTHEIEKILGTNFLRIHRSFIVNISKVAAFNAEEIFVDTKNLPIGVSYKKQVESVFRKHVY